MFKNNLPPEIKKTPTFEVRNYEEFINSYSEEEKIIDSYENEFASYSNIGVVRSYGPGNGQSNEKSRQVKEIGKTVGRSIVSSVGLELLKPFASPIIAPQMWMGGKVASKLGRENNNEVLEWVGDAIKDIGTSAAIDLMLGSFSDLNDNKAQGLTKALGITGEIAEMAVDIAGKLKISEEVFWRIFHGEHCDRGVNFNNSCKVCRGDYE